MKEIWLQHATANDALSSDKEDRTDFRTDKCNENLFLKSGTKQYKNYYEILSMLCNGKGRETYFTNKSYSITQVSSRTSTEWQFFFFILRRALFKEDEIQKLFKIIFFSNLWKIPTNFLANLNHTYLLMVISFLQRFHPVTRCIKKLLKISWR